MAVEFVHDNRNEVPSSVQGIENCRCVRCYPLLGKQTRQVSDRHVEEVASSLAMVEDAAPPRSKVATGQLNV